MKVVIVQHKNFLNSAGGTEKIACFLANNLVEKDCEVIVATNDENISGKPMFYLNPKVTIDNLFNPTFIQEEIITLFNYKGYNPFFWLYYKLKKKRDKIYNKKVLKKHGGIEGIYTHNLKERATLWKNYLNNIKPNVIITMSISSLVEITFGNEIQIPILNSVNGRPDYDYTDLLWYRSEIEMRLLQEAYAHLSGIQVLFDSYKAFLPDTFSGEAVTIPNPVIQMDINTIVHHEIPKKVYKIINIASLNSSCKQQDVAIHVFSKIAATYPNWNLEFWGVGNDLAILEEQVAQLQLENRIFFKGFTPEPLEKLKEADIFLFPSKYEGFPLALTEAMAVGLPVIGFQSCSGVNELIQNEKNGFLANDITEMQHKLEELIQNTELRKKMGFMGHESVKKYTEEVVFEKWFRFITQLNEKQN
ncbi:MAG: glycosyltransferase [Flavobacterium sp.]|uniref:glycosyltransferase n=1 Tax=Flavobacterium sp. TaxID=239 RepID=UPI000C692B4A|nr:glycosyltransferase [Flavobacterium sp.]MBF04308.1 glycosyltransferase [Flavobacterium sp.]|tara:strand:- start:4029 stop:5282 length:1254 start_codon:yes stop_codon:yes gene_type:complete